MEALCAARETDEGLNKATPAFARGHEIRRFWNAPGGVVWKL